MRSLAWKIRRTLPSQFDVDDFISEGTIGLMDAATRFDPHRGIPFARFASARIYGAILDYVRTEAPMGRVTYAAVVAGDTTRLRWVDPLEDVHLATIADPAPGPDTHACRRSEATRVRAALAVLSPRERAIVVAHYFHERLHSDIAREHGLSNGRVSQLETRALGKLRRVLGAPPVVPRTAPPTRVQMSKTPWMQDVYRERAKAKRLWDAA